MFKRISVIAFSVLLWMATIAPTAHALVGDDVISGFRWFPCEPLYQNDFIWEVECVDPTVPFDEPTFFQGFDMTPDVTGYANLLATTYDENGGLTLTRTDVADDEQLTAHIRTLILDYGCIIDPEADTLYYDIEAVDCGWDVSLTFENDYTIRLGHLLAQTGDDSMEPPAGHYSGAVHFRTLLETLANGTDADNATTAAAVLALETLYTPRIQITYSGGTDGALTLHSFFLAPADDPDGRACKTATLDMIMPSTDCEWDEPDITVTPLEDLVIPTAATTSPTPPTTATSEPSSATSIVFIAVPCVIILVIAGTIIWRRHQ